MPTLSVMVYLLSFYKLTYLTSFNARIQNIAAHVIAYSLFTITTSLNVSPAPTFSTYIGFPLNMGKTSK